MSENWKGEATDRLCDAFLTLKTREEVYAFLEDVATISHVRRCLDYDPGGYKMVLDRLKNNEAKTSK